MKNYILLFVGISLAVACHQDNQPFENHSQQTNLQNTVLNTETLNDICEQLISEYQNQAPAQSAKTLQQKIDLLDSIALQNSSFTVLEPSGYTKITAAEADVFLTDVESGYSDLIVSVTMASYLDIILSNNYSPAVLRHDIETDRLLTNLEKITLHFMLDRIAQESGYHDPTWDKQNIVGIIMGYQDNQAQAVFNAALVSICQE